MLTARSASRLPAADPPPAANTMPTITPAAKPIPKRITRSSRKAPTRAPYPDSSTGCPPAGVNDGSREPSGAVPGGGGGGGGGGQEPAGGGVWSMTAVGRGRDARLSSIALVDSAAFERSGAAR